MSINLKKHPKQPTHIQCAAITTIADIDQFLFYMVVKRRCVFDPDTPIHNYINMRTVKPTFTPEEVSELTQRVTECFELHERRGSSFYKQAMKYQGIADRKYLYLSKTNGKIYRNTLTFFELVGVCDGRDLGYTPGSLLWFTVNANPNEKFGSLANGGETYTRVR
jgi:hypothetical protein